MKTYCLSFIVCVSFSFTTVFSTIAQNTFSRAYHLNDSAITANAITKTLSNEFVLCGRIGNNNSNPYYCKIDSLGEIIWSKTLPILGELFDVVCTQDSCYAITGYIQYTNTFQNLFFCAKVSNSGDIIWKRELDFTPISSSLSIQSTFDNGFILSGYTEDAPFSNTNTRSIIIKLDEHGSVDWARKDYIDNAPSTTHSIIQTSDSGYVCIGNIYDQQSSLYIMKLNSSGDELWIKRQAATDNCSSFAGGIIETDSGYIALTGIQEANSYHHSMVLLNTDFEGNVLKAMDLHSTFYSFSKGMLYRNNSDGYFMTSGREFFMVNSSLSQATTGQYFFNTIIDYSATGDNGYMILGEGPVLVRKNIQSPHYGIIKTDSTGYSEYCFVGLSPTTIDSISINLDGISTVSSNSFLVIAQILQTNDINVHSYDGCVGFTGSVDENEEQNKTVVFPNPTNGLFHLSAQTSGSMIPEQLMIFNTMGQMIQKIEAQPEMDIDLSNQPDGIYFVKLIAGNKTFINKIVKQSD